MSLAALHGAHPYFAKFHYDLPLEEILRHTQPGDIVLDPFCGSGTSLIAAASAARHAVGIDANPLACLIARVKTSVPSDEDLDELAGLHERAVAMADAASGRGTLFAKLPEIEPATAPTIFNGEYWFEPSVIDDLRGIKGLVSTATRPVVADAAMFAFSRIIVRASNQQGESVYRRVQKGHIAGQCWDMFVGSLLDTIDCLTKSRGTLSRNITVRVFNNDCRSFHPDGLQADLIVTSPPYLNSWDYSLYQKFRMLWLGYDPKAYSEIEIGNHLRTLRDGDREIARYRIDMSNVFQNLAKSLRPGGHCVFVNGETVVSGEIINSDDIITESAAAAGLMFCSKELRRVLGPHYGNHASMKSRKVVSKIIKEKTESILTYRSLP